MSILNKIFLSLILFGGILSLKLQLVDEDYVIVQIGYPPKEYKLMVDPVGPFTYLFKEMIVHQKLLEKKQNHILFQMFLEISQEIGKMIFSI